MSPNNISHLPEASYLAGEREMEIAEARRTSIADITVIYDHDLPEQFQASSMYGCVPWEQRVGCVPWEQRVEEFKQWCVLNNVYYYGRPRESFFRSEAFELASAAGCTKLLLEDMS